MSASVAACATPHISVLATYNLTNSPASVSAPTSTTVLVTQYSIPAPANVSVLYH